jgi:hypothetical protein
VTGGDVTEGCDVTGKVTGQVTDRESSSAGGIFRYSKAAANGSAAATKNSSLGLGGRLRRAFSL